MDARSKNKINRFKGQLEALTHDYNPNHDPKDGRFTSGSGIPSTFAEEAARGPMRELEGQAYEFLEQQLGGNGEELMDLWEVSEPYEEDGITYVDADYNVRNENGKREDRTSKVPVSSKGYDEKKINDISSRMNNGGDTGEEWKEIRDIFQRQKVGTVVTERGDRGSMTQWEKTAAGEWTNTQSGDKFDDKLMSMSWTGNRYKPTVEFSVKENAPTTEAVKESQLAAVNGRLNQALGIVGDEEMRVVGDMMIGDFNPNHDPADGRFTSGGGAGGDYDDDDDEEDDGDLSSLNSMTEGHFWGRRSDLEDELSDAGFDVLESNGEWITVSSPDPDSDAQYQLLLGGTDSTVVVNSINTLDEMNLVNSMMMGNFTGDEDRWVTINGTHVFIENGEISKGPSALTGKKSTKGSSGAVNGKGTMDPKQLASAEKRRDELWNKQDHGKLSSEEESELKDLQKKISGHYSEKKKSTGSEKKTSTKRTRSHENSRKRALKELGLDDFEYKDSDSQDFFDSDRGSISIGALEDAVDHAYQEGVAYSKRHRSISAAQISKEVKKLAKKEFDFDLKVKDRDGYDYFGNDRGSFSVVDLETALEHAYGEGFSSGD